jgi:hypothetical protein
LVATRDKSGFDVGYDDARPQHCGPGRVRRRRFDHGEFADGLSAGGFTSVGSFVGALSFQLSLRATLPAGRVKKKNFSSWSFLMHRSTDHVKL